MKNRIHPSAKHSTSSKNQIHLEGVSTRFYRPVWVEIDHKNLKHNFLELSKIVSPQVSLLTVVKANAYGHGLIPVSKTLSECRADFLGVSSIEEALSLKETRIKKPILILGNIYPFTNLELAIQEKIRVTVASVDSAKMCDLYARKLGKKVYAHAKVDTGMNRIGVNIQKGLEFIRKILEFPTIRLEGIYTHFSGSAEDPKFTMRQLELFTKFVSELRTLKIGIPYIHCANSAALIKYPESHLTMVRPGISLYGFCPFPTSRKVSLKPVLSWKSRIVFLKDVPIGTPVSYGGTFRTKRKSKIATASFGYADGYRRSLSNRGWVLVNGQRVPVIGRVTMDMTMLDVTDLSGVQVGDEVVLIGKQDKEEITVQEMAQWTETIPYEVFCGITSRVPRINLYTSIDDRERK